MSGCPICGRPMGDRPNPLLSDDMVELVAEKLAKLDYAGDHVTLKHRFMARELLEAIVAAKEGDRITHGRHCVCSACARQDWTDSRLASCGMHGASCPARYQPLGMAGAIVTAKEKG